MEQNKKLSLKEEVEKEAKKIEEEIANHPDLEDMKVSEKMEAALLADIRAYEKKCAEKKEKKNSTEDGAEEFSEEIAPNFIKCTNDNHVVGLSAEDMEALRLGRELLKKKNGSVEKELFEVNTDYHKHLNSDNNGKEGKKNKGEKAGVFRMPRKKRLVAALVAVFVLVLATGVTSVGSKSYWKALWEKIHGDESMKVVNVEDMDTQDSEDGNEVTAFREIGDTFNILAVRIGAKPKGMCMDNYIIDTEQKMAQLFYSYNGEIIRFTIYINDADSSLSQKEEDDLQNKYLVKTSKQEIVIKEYGKAKEFRYMADFEYKGIGYQLKGVMEKDKFIEIIKNLLYFN